MLGPARRLTLRVTGATGALIIIAIVVRKPNDTPHWAVASSLIQDGQQSMVAPPLCLRAVQPGGGPLALVVYVLTLARVISKLSLVVNLTKSDFVNIILV